jgi:hypothetical protein
MKSSHFVNVLPRLGMANSNQISSGDQWQFWTAEVDGPFGHQKVSFLYLNSKAAWSGLPIATTNAKKRIEKGSPFYVVVQNSADLARDLHRLRRETGFQNIFTVRELLSKSVARVLRINPADAAQSVQHEVFVDPDIRKNGKEEKAIETLTGWLTADSDFGSRIGILVAPAGVGKTTVARHCFQQLARAADKWRLPLLVTSDQWAKLADRPNITLWDVWRESLDVFYSCSVSREDLAMFMENGVFLPIFDGLDELCTRSWVGGGATNAFVVRSFRQKQSTLRGAVRTSWALSDLYGQHSFIYDLIATAHRRGVHVTLLVEGLAAFPLAEPVKKYARVFEMDEAGQLGPIDLILVDEPTDKLVMSLPTGCPAICVIHKKTRGGLHAGVGKALEVVLAHRLHLGWCRSDAAQLRADAKAGRGLAEE